jgi:outer membrane protein assembly factor BamB
MSGNHLLALDAVTGNSVQSSTQSTWLTTSNGGVHWQSPIVVNGMLYLFDNGNPTQVWAYQLDGIFKGGFQ